MRYPIYIPTRGRFDNCITAKLLDRQGLSYTLVVEEDERDSYARVYGASKILVSNGGSEVKARNLAKAHSKAMGFERHWQLDDDIYSIVEIENRKIVGKSVDKALSYVENFTDLYANVAISGLALAAFGKLSKDPHKINKQICNCFLVLNKTEHLWREGVVSDTDYSLQVLSDGWCTINFYNYLATLANTETMKGGNTDFYKEGGRDSSAEGMMKAWPDITKIVYRFGRPKVYTGHLWRKFKQELQRK